MTIVIDDKLHVIFEADRGVLIHHTPISRDTFEANFDLLQMTKAAFDAHGTSYAIQAGPLTSALELVKQDAKLIEEGAPARAQSLLDELERLTMIVAPRDGSYRAQPIMRDHGGIDDESWREVRSQLVFFTYSYWSVPKRVRPKLVDVLSSGGLFLTTPLDATAYASSLQTLTKDGGSAAA